MGRVEGITLVKDAKGAIERVEAVRAEAGEGLEGDYHGDLTLSAAEALEGLSVEGHETRRNLLTTGIDLNAQQVAPRLVALDGEPRDAAQPADDRDRPQRSRGQALHGRRRGGR